MGIASPLGLGVFPMSGSSWWKGKSGIRQIQSFDVTDLAAKIAGQVPVGTREPRAVFRSPNGSP